MEKNSKLSFEKKKLHLVFSSVSEKKSFRFSETLKTKHHIVPWEFFEGMFFDCLFLNGKVEWLLKMSKEKNALEDLSVKKKWKGNNFHQEMSVDFTKSFKLYDFAFLNRS